jgi:hypothetical protein
MDEVHTHRDTYKADVCVLIIDNPSACGLASAIMATEASAFCAVHWDCATGYYSFAHEIGHLQGARHNPEVDPNTSPFPYGHGYLYIPDGWRTIMAYNHSSCPGGYCTRVQYWSNPGIIYPPSGVPTGTAATHDNARVLDETAFTVANFRVSGTTTDCFTIENAGTAPLVMNDIYDNKPWLTLSGFPSLPFSILPGNSQLVCVAVDWNLVPPPQETATVTFESNDPNEPVLTRPVTAIPTATQPILSVNPSNRNVTASSGSTTFDVDNVGSGTMNWTASVVSGGSWCTITSGGSGTNSGTINVSYTANPNTTVRVATIRVTAPGATGSPTDVTVSQAGTIIGEIFCPLNAHQNSTATMEIKVDMTGSLPPEDLLGSFSGTLAFDPALVSVNAHSGILSGFIGNVVVSPGLIDFNGVNPTGVGGVVDILNIDFDVNGAVGATVVMDLEFSAMLAAISFTNLLPGLTVNDCSFDIDPPCLSGDVNGDGQCNSSDALLILSHDVGIAVPPNVLALILQGCGDVNGDGFTNSGDALIVLSFDVGIPVPFPVCQ